MLGLAYLQIFLRNILVGAFKIVKVEGYDVPIPDLNYKIQIQDNDLVGVMDENLEDMDYYYFETVDKVFGQTDIYFKGEFIRDNSNEITSLIIIKNERVFHLNKL